jgi:beta-lactamase class D
MRWCLVAIVVCGAATAGQAPRPQDATRQCVVIVDERAGTTWRSDVDGCATRLSPASTFKIPHALVALETGVLQPDTVEKWDGSRHPAQPLWDRDHTVLTAMKPSVLWFFQRIAPRIGAERMRQWLERMHYGNADTSGDIRSYAAFIVLCRSGRRRRR